MIRHRPADAEPSLRTLPNLGPASERMLGAASIHTPSQLRALGAVRAFQAVRQAGHQPSLNLLWALEGALTNRDWNAVARHERTALLMQLDDWGRSCPGDSAQFE